METPRHKITQKQDFDTYHKHFQDSENVITLKYTSSELHKYFWDIAVLHRKANRVQENLQIQSRVFIKFKSGQPGGKSRRLGNRVL